MLNMNPLFGMLRPQTKTQIANEVSAILQEKSDAKNTPAPRYLLHVDHGEGGYGGAYANIRDMATLKEGEFETEPVVKTTDGFMRKNALEVKWLGGDLKKWGAEIAAKITQLLNGIDRSHYLDEEMGQNPAFFLEVRNATELFPNLNGVLNPNQSLFILDEGSTEYYTQYHPKPNLPKPLSNLFVLDPNLDEAFSRPE